GLLEFTPVTRNGQLLEARAEIAEGVSVVHRGDTLRQRLPVRPLPTLAQSRRVRARGHLVQKGDHMIANRQALLRLPLGDRFQFAAQLVLLAFFRDAYESPQEWAHTRDRVRLREFL